MQMRGTDIKREAENYIDEHIDDLEAVDAINRAMNLIGDMAHVYETASATITEARAWHVLPKTLTYVVEVEDEHGHPYENYRTRDNLIYFGRPGTFTVHYRRLPNRLTNISAEPDIHPAFHQVLVTYLIGWWKLKDDDENPDGLRHMVEFKEDTVRVFHTLSRRRGPQTIQVIRHA